MPDREPDEQEGWKIVGSRPEREVLSDQLVCTPAQCREACGGTTMGTCAYPHPSEVEAARLRAVQQWRAVGIDHAVSSDGPVLSREPEAWRYSLERAERDFGNLEASFPGFDEVWLETRWMSLPERVAREALNGGDANA